MISSGCKFEVSVKLILVTSLFFFANVKCQADPERNLEVSSASLSFDEHSDRRQTSQDSISHVHNPNRPITKRHSEQISPTSANVDVVEISNYSVAIGVKSDSLERKERNLSLSIDEVLNEDAKNLKNNHSTDASPITPTTPDTRVFPDDHPTTNNFSTISSPQSAESGLIEGTFTSTNVSESSLQPRIATSCGTNITLNSQVTRIVSPGWDDGEKYPPSTQCVWTISVSRSIFIQRETTIHIRVKHLDIEPDGDGECAFDILEIHGFEKLCGSIENREIVINASNIVMSFRSDSNGEDHGFELELYSHVSDCASELIITNSSGEITSPGFPNEYPLTFDCWTLFNASSESIRASEVDPGNLIISLTFDVIQMESDGDCNSDYIELFAVDDTKQPSTSLGKFCDENSLKRTIDSSSFSRSSYEPSSESSNSPSLTNDNMKSRPKISTKGPYLYLHFVSDSHVSKSGFKASYKIESDLSRSSLSDCDWTLKNDSKRLNSPGYPEPYPPNLDCSLTLESPRLDEKIILVFETFIMETDNNCSHDRLEIYDEYASSLQTELPVSKVPTKTYCGTRAKFSYRSAGPSLRLRFVSDEDNVERGFSARYSFQSKSVKPMETFTRVPRNASVHLSSSHLLHCQPFIKKENGRNPEAKRKNITWFKDGTKINEGISENGTKLLIHEFLEKDVGKYTCKYGSASVDAWLEVETKECGVIFRERPCDKTVTEGDIYYIFWCDPVLPDRPNSKMTISWTKNGIDIKDLNNTRLEILESDVLAINRPSPEDEGLYFCIVKSESPDCIAEAGARLYVKRRLNVESICGVSDKAIPYSPNPNHDSTGKIVGGTSASKGAYPWQVMLWTAKSGSFCGGSILNERWIVTAAHCVTASRPKVPPPQSDIMARLGKHDQEYDEEGEKSFRIELIISHPSYNPRNFDNDIALLRVKNRIQFSDYIKPICLGSRAEIEKIFFTNISDSIKMGHVTGWGFLKERGGKPRYLQEIQVPIVDQPICRRSTSLPISDNMFCAGYAQELFGDACKGDSGGPFVSFLDGRWYLLGIVSWGDGCGRAGKYGFYTKVPNYIDWIKKLIMIKAHK